MLVIVLVSAIVLGLYPGLGVTAASVWVMLQRYPHTSPAHDTNRSQGQRVHNANQADVYAHRTLDSNNADLIFLVVWVDASAEQALDSLCAEVCVCVHISERKLGSSMSKDPAMNQRTDEFCLCECECECAINQRMDEFCVCMSVSVCVHISERKLG